ncbi:MAG: hypothetical protein PHV34_24325 [Verrucomicrobiae bacterium]|nr:hypothetical protein [Verrucomicrobiae bacterium]
MPYRTTGLTLCAMMGLVLSPDVFGENLMPNPGAEEVTEAKHEKPPADPRVTTADWIPAKGWGCSNSSGCCEWGVTEENPHRGKYCASLKVVKLNDKGGITVELCLGGKSDGMTGQDAIPTAPNTSYYFSLWLRGNAPLAHIKWLGWTDDAGAPKNREWKTTAFKSGVIPTAEWKRYEGSLTTTEKTKKFALRIQIPSNCGAQPGQSVCVDDVEIIPFAEKFAP